MARYPYTTAASILLLASAILLTGAAYRLSEFETLFLFVLGVAFAIGGLRLMWSRDSHEQ